MRFRSEEGGTIIVLVALSMTALLGSVGTVIDLGAAQRQVRVLQNATDAGALVGARAVAAQSFATIQRDITDYAERNGTPDSNAVRWDGVNDNVTWQFIANDNSTTTQALATGVRVRAQHELRTNFLGIIGISTLRVGAESRASVERLSALTGTPPFAVYDTQRNGTLPLLTRDGTGNPTGLDQAAVGQTFAVHGPQVDHPFSNDSFKGLLDTDRGPLSVGDTIDYLPGVHAGPTRDSIQAIGTSYVILPIFDARDAASDRVHVVAFAAFNVVETGANTHDGTLVSGSFIGIGTGVRDWTPSASFNVSALKLVD